MRYKPFQNNRRSFCSLPWEQQTNAHTQAMNAMAEMVRALQNDVRAAAESRFQAKDKELMTTKRTFTMLPSIREKLRSMRPGAFR